MRRSKQQTAGEGEGDQVKAGMDALTASNGHAASKFVPRNGAKPKKPVAKATPPAPSMAEKAYPRGTESPRDAASNPASAGNVGMPYVRMLNISDCVRAVVVSLVPMRLMEGYRFIIDEPVLPREVGANPDRCDKHGTPHWYPRARANLPRPGSFADALQVWLDAACEDAVAFAGHPEIDFDYLKVLTKRCARVQSVGSEPVN